MKSYIIRFHMYSVDPDLNLILYKGTYPTKEQAVKRMKDIIEYHGLEWTPLYENTYRIYGWEGEPNAGKDPISYASIYPIDNEDFLNA